MTIITEEELNDLEDKEINIITEEDIEYSLKTDSEEEIKTYSIDNKDKEKLSGSLLIEEKKETFLNRELDIEEANQIKNTEKNIGNNFLEKNRTYYNKENWNKMHNDIPVISIGKQNKFDKEIEYNIDNKFITGFEKHNFKNYSNINFFRNVEFEGKKFFSIFYK